MPGLLNIYHSLPYPLRVVAASAWGYHLRWWRYGSDTEMLVEQALDREGWDPLQWKHWKEEQLAFVLERAAVHVPYYREYWSKRRRKGDRAAWDRLENWPVLEKATVQQDPEAFIADDRDRRWMYREHTSGSTGTPVQLWFSRSVLHSWFAIFEARWHRWYGVSLKDRWGMVGGQQVTPFEQTKPPFWVWNAAFNQLYMSSLHIRPDLLGHYLDAIKRYSLDYLLGYSSGLYWLAMQAEMEHIQIPMQAVLTDAEPLYEWQRTVISRAFNCPVRETYGQAEMICAAGECEHGRIHLWPEVGVNELLDDNDKPVADGIAGKLIGTSLMNLDMPLIRYDSTDMAIAPKLNATCACGRNLPILEKILGRADDFLITPDGRRVMLLDIVFSPDMHLVEAQIIQESLEKITIKVVPTSAWRDNDRTAISDNIRERMGDVQVSIELVGEIERTWAGKFKVLVSLINSRPGPPTR